MQQYVQIIHNCSEFHNIKCGVAQGGILGPLLFNLYMNDIVKLSNDVHFIIYQDDTSQFCFLETIWTVIRGEAHGYNFFICSCFFISLVTHIFSTSHLMM